MSKVSEPIVDACLQAMLSLDLRETCFGLAIHHSPGDGIQVQIIRMLAEVAKPALGFGTLWAKRMLPRMSSTDSSTQSKLKPEDAITFSVDLKQGGTMARQATIKGLAGFEDLDHPRTTSDNSSRKFGTRTHAGNH